MTALGSYHKTFYFRDYSSPLQAKLFVSGSQFHLSLTLDRAPALPSTIIAIRMEVIAIEKLYGTVLVRNFKVL